MRLRGRPVAFELTTLHPDYIAARKRLADPGHKPDTNDIMALLGVARTAAQTYGRDGKYGGHLEDGKYIFDRMEIRREIGLER